MYLRVDTKAGRRRQRQRPKRQGSHTHHNPPTAPSGRVLVRHLDLLMSGTEQIARLGEALAQMRKAGVLGDPAA